VREGVSVVLNVPLVLLLIELAFLQLIILVFWSILRIEETHERTVGNERNDAFCLIIPKF